MSKTKTDIPRKCRYCMYWVSGNCRALPKFPHDGLYEVEIRVGLFGRKERVLRRVDNLSPWYMETKASDGCALFVFGASDVEAHA